MLKKPVIGVTLDSQESGGYTMYPWYALREFYCSSIIDPGGIPFPLSHSLELIDSYLSLIDGLVITGGSHDINPPLYGVQKVHAAIKLNPKRTDFELALAKAALDKNIPVLGICGGLQVINVALGGTLIQHIPDEVSEHLEHYQLLCRTQPTHTVNILKNTLLYKMVDKEEIDVNSVHHQAVKKLGQGVVVNAIAPDGVIEGIEAPAYTFCLGLQWHPEFIVSPQDRAVFEAFMDAARG